MFNLRRILKRYAQLQWEWVDKNWSDSEGMAWYRGYGYDNRTARAFRKLFWQAVREEFNR